MKLNCWEFNHCGRELGGAKAKTLGVCQSVTFIAFNQTNDGFNAGRYCWNVSGTKKDTPKTCVHHPPLDDCGKCEFYKTVQKEEDLNFID